MMSLIGSLIESLCYSGLNRYYQTLSRLWIQTISRGKRHIKQQGNLPLLISLLSKSLSTYPANKKSQLSNICEGIAETHRISHERASRDGSSGHITQSWYLCIWLWTRNFSDRCGRSCEKILYVAFWGSGTTRSSSFYYKHTGSASRVMCRMRATIASNRRGGTRNITFKSNTTFSNIFGDSFNDSSSILLKTTRQFKSLALDNNIWVYLKDTHDNYRKYRHGNYDFYESKTGRMSWPSGAKILKNRHHTIF